MWPTNRVYNFYNGDEAMGLSGQFGWVSQYLPQFLRGGPPETKSHFTSAAADLPPIHPSASRSTGLDAYWDQVRDQVTSHAEHPYKFVGPDTPLEQFGSRDAEKWRDRLKLGAASVRQFLNKVGLPDEAGLLAKRAVRFGLRPKVLEEIGLTDRHVYIDLGVHETNHIRGQAARRWQGGDFEDNEGIVYAFDEARLATNSLPAEREGLHLVRNMALMSNILEELKERIGSRQYGWTPSTSALVRARLRSQPEIWDRQNDRFDDKFYQKLKDATQPDFLREGHRPFALARAVLECYVDPKRFEQAKTSDVPFMLRIRDAARQGERDLKNEGHTGVINKGEYRDQLRAALILRQFARSIDDVTKYADDYRPSIDAAPLLTLPAAKI